MGYDIAFPHLGIFLEKVGWGVTLPIGGGFTIAYYGMVIGCGMLLGLTIACLDAKRRGQDTDLYVDYVIWAILCGVLGARLYYVIFSWDMYKNNLLEILNLRGGGLAIYGGIIGALTALYVFTKKKKISYFYIADSGVIGLALGQAIGRWGNFFNREAFGGYTDSLLAMRLKLSDVSSGMLNASVLEHALTDNGVQYIQVHPTFLYESLWNLGLVLILWLHSPHRKFEGENFFLYLSGYGLGRFIIEGLRTDSLMVPGLPIRVSQLLALLCLIAGVTCIVLGRKKAAAK